MLLFFLKQNSSRRRGAKRRLQFCATLLIVERLIRFMDMHIYSQNKAFYEEMINTKNVALLLDFTNMPKGGAKRGGSALWGPVNEGSFLQNGDFFIFSILGVCIWKGGQKGGQHSWPSVLTQYIIIRSWERHFWGKILNFWHNCYFKSDVDICPPFAPPF